MDMFEACIKVSGTTPNLTEVTDLNGHTGGIIDSRGEYSPILSMVEYTCGLTQRLSHADT